jgi:hypothetical protein
MKQQIINDIMNADRDEMREQPLSRQESEDMIILWDRFLGSLVTEGFDLSDLPLSSLEIMKEIGDIIDRDIIMIHVDDTDLSPRAKLSLTNTREDFEYLDNVYRYFLREGENGLLKMRNFGRKSLREIREAFKEHFNHSH